MSEFKGISTQWFPPTSFFEFLSSSSILRGVLQTVGFFFFLSVTERMFKEGTGFTGLVL